MQRQQTKRNDAGFSLLEALVALVVLSVSANAILSAAQSHTQSVIGLHDRTIALWVAENRLSEQSLGYADLPETLDMAGQSWRIATTVQPSPDSALMRVDIHVARAADPDAALAVLTGYVTAREAE